MASLYRRSLLSFLPATLLISLSTSIAALLAMNGFYGDVMGERLGNTVDALVATLPPGSAEWFSDTKSDAMAWAASLDAASNFRITLMRPDGVVVADSRAEPATMENHGHRPEMRAALAGGTGVSRRTSVTLGRELFYAARAVRDPATRRILGVLRIAVDLPGLRTRLAPARDLLLAMVLFVGLVAILAAVAFARSVSAPLHRLSEAALSFGRGRPAYKGRALGAGSERAESTARDEIRLAALASGPDEVRVLASALDSMVKELEGRNRAELLAGSERAAILDGMSEAVVSLDAELRLRTVNRAARELFGLAEAKENRGMPLVEITRSSELAALAAEARSAKGPIERELALYGGAGERWFRVVARPIEALPPGERGEAAPGLVLVLDDISQLRRLERVRRDFVANVSHELRTPVQVIKGFVETLQEGALEDQVKSRRYVDIIGRNAGRMENLILDLLALARLEQEGSVELERSEEDVSVLVDEALSAVGPKAEAKGMVLEAEVEPGLRARLHGGLVVQALVNLLDNAIKYTPAGGPVRVRALRESGEGRDFLLLEVRDRGPGIPARDLPRLFERFYTVDKARSRELGGTGLGLAIVRHVALAHGGEAGAESWEGEGSRIWLRFPIGESEDSTDRRPS